MTKIVSFPGDVNAAGKYFHPNISNLELPNSAGKPFKNLYIPHDQQLGCKELAGIADSGGKAWG